METDRARRVDFALTATCQAVGALRRAGGVEAARLLTEGQSLPLAAGGPTVILKLAGLGSLCLLAPVVKAFAAAAATPPVFVTLAENRGFVELLDWGAETVYLETGAWRQTLGSARGLMRGLRARRPAATVDLEFYSRAVTLLTLGIGAPIRAAFAEAPWRAHLVTHSVPWGPQWHLAQISARLLGQLAGAPLAVPVELPLRADALPEPPLRATGGRRLVVVNVNAGPLCLERRLPPRHFAGLLRRLASEHDVELAFIGGAGEARYVEGAIALAGHELRCHNLAGRTTLPQLLALIRSAALVITNDTGPLHFAVGLGTPSLSFFGPEDPARFGPRGGPHTVVYGRAVCSPCFHERNLKTAPCRGQNACLSALDPAALGEVAVAALAQPPESPQVVRLGVAEGGHGA